MIKRDCYWYTWGGNPEKGFPLYPKGEGAKCMQRETGFRLLYAGYYLPDCNSCKYYSKEKK